MLMVSLAWVKLGTDFAVMELVDKFLNSGRLGYSASCTQCICSVWYTKVTICSNLVCSQLICRGLSKFRLVLNNQR